MLPLEPGQGRSRWVRELRRHHEGTLLTGDRAVAVRFVVDGSCGRMVFSVEGWVLDLDEGALFLPEERRDALQVLIELDAAEPSGAAQDRWAAYHGEPRLRHWALARITGVRREDEVCEEAEIALINPLRAAENSLLKLLNAQRSALIGVCRCLAGVELTDACAVGADSYGIDVRARFGIVRVEFPSALCDPSKGIECPDRAADVIRGLLRDAGGTGA